VKAKAYQVDALKTQIQGRFKGALIFGSDFGVVQETAAKITKLIVSDIHDDFSVCRIVPSQLRETPSLLLDEGNSVLLMGGRRLIWLRDAENHALEAVDSFVTHIQTDSFLLITADNLTKSSGLRTFCEGHPDILTIACYPDEAKDVAVFIRETLGEQGISVDPKALSLLVERLNENRLATRRELEKLIVYLGDKKTVTKEDVIAVVTDTTNTSLDLFCCAVAEGNQKNADRAASLLLSNGENPVGLVRVLINHFNLLLMASDILNDGANLEVAVKKILKPAQFRLEETIKRQLMIWKKEFIFKVLELLLDTEQQIKRTGMPGELILSRAVTQIAAKANRLCR
jgi:DNA polymerase-3 subunit delta